MSNYLEERAVLVWKNKEATLSVVHLNETYCNHYCGYVRIPKAPFFMLDERGGESNMMQYIPVHGGITFSRKLDGDWVFGFDCNHYNSSSMPETRNLEWLSRQCSMLLFGIRNIRPYWLRYMACRSEVSKAKVLDEFISLFPQDSRQEYSFGIMLNLLSGGL